MKSLPAILVLLMLVLGFFFVRDYTVTMAPVWRSSGEQQAKLAFLDEQNRVAEERLRRVAWTNFWQVGLPVALTLVVAIGGTFIWILINRRKEAWARPVDGSFPLQNFNQGGVKLVIDPNKSLSGVVGYNPQSGLLSDFQSVGSDRQLTYGLAVQKTRTTQARTTIGGRITATDYRAEAGHYDAKPTAYPALTTGEPMAPPWQPVGIGEAFEQSTHEDWVVGQNSEGLCHLNLREVGHLGILGATRTGKTAGTGVLVMLLALKSKYHVIALDAKGLIDWGRYTGYAEVYPTDFDLFPDQLTGVFRLYQERQSLLERYGAANIYELPSSVKPVLVLMEEFGDLMDHLKADNPTFHTSTESQLREMYRRSAATGIHLAAIDQAMSGWPKIMRANAKGIIAYRIGGNQGAAFSAYKLHELKAKGEFWYDGSVYEGWDAAANATKILEGLPHRNQKLLTAGSSGSSNYGKGGVKPGLDSPQRNVVQRSTTPEPLNEITLVATNAQPDSYRATPVAQPVASSTDVAQRLHSKPTTRSERELVRNVYALSNNSRRKTILILWGKWTPDRDKWTKEIVSTEEG